MSTTPSKVAACRGCLATDGLSLIGSGLRGVFVQLTGVPVSTLHQLQYVCTICHAQLSKLAAFRDRCQRTNRLLKNLTKDGPLTKAKITSIDRQLHKLTLNLSQSSVYTTDSEEHESELQQTSIKHEIKDDISVDSPHFTPLNTDVEDSDDSIETEENDKELSQNEGSSAIAVSNIPTNNDTGNTEILSLKGKRRKIGDDIYPIFDYGKFEKEFKVKIKLLSKEEQRKELEDRKLTKNYLNCPFRCETCGKGFNYEKSHRNHMSYHDPELGPFECDICHFRFRLNRKRVKHMDLHRLKFTCCACGAETRDRCNARRHSAQHAGASHACLHCDAVFHCRSSYFNHMRVQHPAKNVACDRCGETFLSRRGVAMHQARAHRPNVKPEDFKCPTCDVSFSSLDALERHTAAGEHSAHPCVECGEGCGSEELLEAHVEGLHKPQRCDECGVSFSNAAAFDLHHRRKHLNMRGVRGRARAARVVPKPRAARVVPKPRAARVVPKPRAARAGPRAARVVSAATRAALDAARVVCEQCGRLVQNESVLKHHQLIHRDVKPYACPHCPKTFAVKHSRDWHIRTHTGERPFQCEQCPQKFSLEGNLKRHRRVVHQGIRESVPCPLCGKIFSRRSCVQLHINFVHKRMPAPKRKRTKKKKLESDENNK